MFDDLKVGPQWCVTLADVRAIASEYGWTVPAQDIEIFGGAVNGVARVKTSVGDIVIRIHRPWTTPQRLGAVHAVQDDLRKRGIPISRVLATRTGATWAILPTRSGLHGHGQHQRPIEVAEFEESDPRELSRQRSDIAIGTLARFMRR